MIHWEDEFSTGVEEIDVQHRWLFDFTNTLEQDLVTKHKKSDVGKLLELLGDYSKRHFHFEEDCMNKWKCPFAEKK